MTSIAFRNGNPIMRAGQVATGQDCCCVECCCNNITLNDLLYGTKEYSWSSVRPSGLRTPEIGVIGNPPPLPSAHCTDPRETNDTSTIANCCNEIAPGVFEWTCGWKLKPACLRWVCRCVDKDHNVVCHKLYGGPTLNGLDLTSLALNKFGAETQHGCFVYTFEFFGWRKRRGPVWQGRDDVYSVYKTKVTSCPA